MLIFGLGMGALLAAIGLITYYVAPRVGPNPIFGVRVGYSFASREVWDKTNRVGGMLMALTGLAFALFALALQELSVLTSAGTALLTIVLIVALIGETGWLFLYARRLAQGAAVREIAPVPFRWGYLAPVLAAFGLLAALAAYSYPLLPAERIATHFNLSDQPDGWMTRDAFYVTYIGLAALFVLLDGLLVLAATREPLIAFGRWSTSWRLDPERGLIYVGLAFAIVELILALLLWDLTCFNTRGAHLFPLVNLFWIILVVIGILIALFFALARRESTAHPG